MRLLLSRLARSGPIRVGWCEAGAAAAGAATVALAGRPASVESDWWLTVAWWVALLWWLVPTWWAVALTVIDLHERRLPDALTLPAAAVALLYAAATGTGGAAVLGALTLFVVYLLVHLARPAALGGGDVKLALPVGALTGAAGASTWLLAAVLATAATAAAGLVALALRHHGARIAHGPGMCAGAILALIAAS
ncbi:prepilin peptidase [Rhodococcus sp. D2-41]|nr:prepilin peptidase [Rhodococcus sp. D2-41]